MPAPEFSSRCSHLEKFRIGLSSNHFTTAVRHEISQRGAIILYACRTRPDGSRRIASRVDLYDDRFHAR